MKIKVFAIGKIKEKYLKEGINEYLERAKSYVRFDSMLSDAMILPIGLSRQLATTCLARRLPAL